VSEFTLHARTAFGRAEPLRDTWPGFAVTEETGVALASVAARRGAGAALRAAARRHFSLDPPGPGWCAAGTPVGFFWIGHEQWFAEAARDTLPDLASALGAALGDTAAITDQSDAWARLRLAGPRTRDVLEKLSPLDHDPSAFPTGAVARTVMEHVAVIIMAVSDEPAFTLLTPRSSARSFRAHLHHAAASTRGPA